MLLFMVVAVLFRTPGSAMDMVNILPNPGFESGLPGPWKEFNFGDYKLVRNADEAHSGEYYATFGWRRPGKGYVSTLESKACNVYPDITYEVGVWARGRGRFRFWIGGYTKSGQPATVDFKKYNNLTNEWKHYKVSWTPQGGVARGILFLDADVGLVANYDDATFSYDAEKFTPPEAEKLIVTPQVKVAGATFKLFLDGKPFDKPRNILYGEHVLAIEARATGDKPRLSGSIRFGEHVINLDKRWRARATMASNAWRDAGFDDREWKQVQGTDGGVWFPHDTKKILLRRVVLWKSQRAEPSRENQWVVLMRDRMFVAEDSAGGFVFIVNESPSKSPATELTMHIEVPAFLKLLDRKEGATFYTTNWLHKKLETSESERDGVKYIHYALTYDINKASHYWTYAPLYFKSDKKILLSDKYTFTFWREANKNITDVPMVIPITVTGPVNGRQCNFFHLTYDGSPACHQANALPYSKAERFELTKTLLDTGMNVMRFRIASTDWGQEYLRFVKKHKVQVWSQFNSGMVHPRQAKDAPYEGPHSVTHQTLDKHPEVQAVLYDGTKAAFEDSLGFTYEDHKGERMWCQEYVAQGGKIFIDSFRPIMEYDKKILGGDMLYVMWDWEYSTFALSCFCKRCKVAFSKFANVPDAPRLSPEQLVTSHPKKWIRFRLEQEARHLLSFAKFLKEYDVLLTNWHPGVSTTSGDFDYSNLGKAYEYHKMGWPGSDLPLFGAGRDGKLTEPWKKLNPDIHVVGMTITNTFWNHVIDERMFKIWTLNIALATHGGGWMLWQEVAWNQTHGQSYFMGEATRLIDAYEEFFKKSKHIESKFQQQGLTGKANELIAIEGPDGKEALVLLFNQSDRPAEVTVTIKDAAAGWTKVQQWEGKIFPNATKLTVTVPEKDVIALLYR